MPYRYGCLDGINHCKNGSGGKTYCRGPTFPYGHDGPVTTSRDGKLFVNCVYECYGCVPDPPPSLKSCKLGEYFVRDIKPAPNGACRAGIYHGENGKGRQNFCKMHSYSANRYKQHVRCHYECYGCLQQ